jgi:glycosyltransferase involved in cell wall biosynthesis
MLGLREQVEIVDAMPRSELMRFSRKSDVGLAFVPTAGDIDINFHAMVGASNKAFDYLASGLPLLVSDLPDWRELYVETGFALACTPEDPDSIAKAIHWYFEHPTELREMGERGRQKILRDWNYEVQFQQITELLAR